MNPPDNYFYLGKIINPNGYKGKVNAYLDTDEPGFYKNLTMVFLLSEGLPVPYFIESIHIINNKATISFQDVYSLEKALLLTQKEIYLPIEELPPLSGNKFYYHEVVGFMVMDKEHGKLGIIDQVLEYPNQAVFQIISNGKEVLIPISDEIIKTVDKNKKLINIEAPDGLIEIYLK